MSLSTWIQHRSDPHLVYARILPALDAVSSAELVCRWGMNLTSSSYMIRALLLVLGDIAAVVQCIILQNKTIMVREFSAWTWACAAPWVRLLNPHAVIYFNINHNLNSSIERNWLLPWLAKFFHVSFIEPAEHTLRLHPWIAPLRIKTPSVTASAPIEEAYFFLGNRPEQLSTTAVDLQLLLATLPIKLRTTIVGGQGGIRLTEQQFETVFQRGNLVVVLYAPAAYNERHSGIVLEALAAGCAIIMFRSELAQSYADRGLSVTLIDQISDLPRAVKHLSVSSSRS